MKGTQAFNPCELGLNTPCETSNINKPFISENHSVYIKNVNNNPYLVGLSQGLSRIACKNV